MGYNSYRHRSYNLSKKKRIDYAKEMEELSDYFENSDDWCISSHLDSCYKIFDDFELRLSNHSAEYVHDLSGEHGLIVNVKMSKSKFIKFIENEISLLIERLNNLSLEKYRYINVVGNNINCYFKGYKTKKETFLLKGNDC